jgi:hypothetical protein
MSKFLVVCHRSRTSDPDMFARIHSVCRHITPTGLPAAAPVIRERNGLITALINPSHCVTATEGAACLGKMMPETANWASVGSRPPDGSFALYRSNEQQLELVADVVASRSIFYYHDSELFIASSSQRAIVALLGDFQPAAEAISWFISSGTLGPAAVWDRRLMFVHGREQVLLDRDTWSLQTHLTEIPFRPEQRSEQEFAAELLEAITCTMNSFRTMHHNDWRLMLSGGADSRALLWMLLRQRCRPSCVTLGMTGAYTSPASDVAIAVQLAHNFGLRHEYLALDEQPLQVEEAISRFVETGEGRADQIASFVDGQRIWQRLANQHVHGLIFGHQVFGLRPCYSAREARAYIGMSLLKDHFAPELLARFELPAQSIPARIRQRPDESLMTWRDRMYQQFRAPLVLAPLDEITAFYVDPVSPLQTRRIVDLLYRMPDAMRTSKRVFKRIALNMIPDIEFATQRAEMLPADLLRSGSFATWTRTELESPYAQTVLSDNLRQYLLARVQGSSNGPEKQSHYTRVRMLLPAPLKRSLRRVGIHPQIHPNVFGFRAGIISRTSRMFAEDIRSLNEMKHVFTYEIT